MPALSPPTQLVIYATTRLRREAWRTVLSGQPGITVAGEAADAARVGALLRPGSPGSVLIDDAGQLPEIAHRLKTAAPEAGLLFLVPLYEVADIVVLLRAGASGCLSLEDSLGDIARAVIAVGRGEIVLPPSMASRALAVLARGEVPAPPGVSGVDHLVEPLSEREADVVRLLAQGLTNKDIAQTLILSVRTVEAHLRSVYGKLAVRSRTEAALWAVRHGYGPQAE